MFTKVTAWQVGYSDNGLFNEYNVCSVVLLMGDLIRTSITDVNV